MALMGSFHPAGDSKAGRNAPGLGVASKTARLRSGIQTGRWLADHRLRSTEGGTRRSTGKLKTRRHPRRFR